jgi:pimeloyl-ACP methyl ester carboxylesterase
MLSYWLLFWTAVLFGWLSFLLGLLASMVVMFRTRAAERRFPPIGEFLDVDGVRVQYLARGPKDAPVLVLLHGNGAAIQDFIVSGFLERAAKRYRVIVLDRPGFGYTQRPRLRLWGPDAQARLVASVLDRLGVEQAFILGHSWGTLVALAFALEFPARTRGLVLASGYYFPTRRKDVYFLSGPAIPIAGDILRYTILPFIAERIAGKVIRQIFAPLPVPPRFEAEFPLALSLRPNTLRASAEETGIMVPAARRLSRRYGEITCPTAIVWGDGDRIVEKEHGPKLKQAIPHAVTREFTGVGHMVHYADPERLLDAVDLVTAWNAQRASG